jgi:hypothetical protein
VQFRIESGLVHQLRQPLTVGQGGPGEDGHGISLGTSAWASAIAVPLLHHINAIDGGVTL